MCIVVRKLLDKKNPILLCIDIFFRINLEVCTITLDEALYNITVYIKPLLEKKFFSIARKYDNIIHLLPTKVKNFQNILLIPSSWSTREQ